MMRGLLVFAALALLTNVAHTAEKPLEALEHINGFRAEHGLAPLRMEARLALLTRNQAMRIMKRHKRDPLDPMGVSLGKQLRRAGYAYKEAKQLVAVGPPNGKSAVDRWLRDHDSRQVLLSRRFREAGIGYARRKDGALKHFWVITLAEPTLPATFNWRREIMRQVNRYRANHGLGLLRIDPVLNIMAQGHSDDMAARDYFGHVTPNGKTVGDRATRAGYPWRTVLENLAAGQEKPSDVVKGWINSPPHRKALLAPNIDEAGVGYTFLAQDGGLVRSFHYWALNMGRRRR